MIFKFTLLSDEADNFIRVINIDSEATFLDLHNAILDSVQFKHDQMTTFFICSDDWEKEQEITLIEMESSSEYDNLVMEDTKLEELISDEKQKLLYVFDLIAERAFFMELTEIIPGKNLLNPECIVTKGDPPVQISINEDSAYISDVSVDENFYGDEEFDLDEIDDEGFGDMNFDNNSLFSEDPKF